MGSWKVLLKGITPKGVTEEDFSAMTLGLADKLACELLAKGLNVQSAHLNYDGVEHSLSDSTSNPEGKPKTVAAPEVAPEVAAAPAVEAAPVAEVLVPAPPVEEATAEVKIEPPPEAFPEHEPVVTHRRHKKER